MWVGIVDWGGADVGGSPPGGEVGVWWLEGETSVVGVAVVVSE